MLTARKWSRYIHELDMTTTLQQWKEAHGVRAESKQQDMFGFGAVGDRFVLRQESAVDYARVAREEREAKEREARADLNQGRLF